MTNAQETEDEAATWSLEQGIAYLAFGEFGESLLPAMTEEWRTETCAAIEASQHTLRQQQEFYPSPLVGLPASVILSDEPPALSNTAYPARRAWQAERERRERKIMPAIRTMVKAINSGRLKAWGSEVDPGTGTSGPTSERRRLQFDSGYEAKIDFTWHEGGGGIPIYCTTRRTDGPTNARFFLHVELSTKDLHALRKSQQAIELKSTGRPTPKPEIIRQFQDHIRQGVAQPRKSQEARLLNNWVKKAHPALPHVSDQTIGDYKEIREHYKKQK